MKKIISIALLLMVVLFCLTGCFKKEETNNTTEENTGSEVQEPVFRKPEKYEECDNIHICFDTESIHLNVEENAFNYNVNDSEGNTQYIKNNIDLNNFPGFKEFIMSEKVQEKLGENEGSKYYIEINMSNGYAVYSTDENNEIFDELYKILKMNDKTIYGEISKSKEEIEKYVNNLEYDYLITRTKDESNDESSNRWNNYTFVNTQKMQMYVVQYWNRSKEDNESGCKDQLSVNVQPIDESELPTYEEQYTKEDSLKKIKSIIDQDTNEEYTVGISGI